jgi:hypothetical protein
MPLDRNFGDQLFRARCLGWTYSFAWRPHRCELSRRIIWLRWAYRGTACHACGDHFIYEHRWRNSIEHLVQVLKT